MRRSSDILLVTVDGSDVAEFDDRPAEGLRPLQNSRFGASEFALHAEHSQAQSPGYDTGPPTAEAQKILDELADLHYFRAYWFRRDLTGISRSGRGAPLRLRDGTGQIRLRRTVRLRPAPADSDVYIVVAIPEVEAV